jgi:ubiquinone/menaquinone biosynthesis C-methylase UbiE
MKNNYKIINKNLKLFKYYNKVKYRSLKYDNYFHAYQDIFSKLKKKKIIVVEIGVANGGSLFMWKKFFGNRAKIIGVDFNPSAKKWEKFGFKIFIGNQSDNKFWKSFFKKVGKIDIIIDDGGHTNEQMINTFNNCYRHIKDEGMLIFEDTHASYMSEFGNPDKGSFINFCYSLVDKINLNFFGKKFLYDYQNYIYKIEFYQSISVFHVSRAKSAQAAALDNGGIVVNANDYRLKDSKLFNFIEKKKIMLRNSYPKLLFLFFKKFYPFIKFLVFKLKPKKYNKYFY